MMGDSDNQKNTAVNNILVFANSSGGLYRFRKELLFELQRSYAVYASTPLNNQVKSLENMGINLIDVSIDRRGINPFKDFSLLLKYRGIIKRVNPCLVILYTIKPNIYGGFISRLYKKKYVANITGLGTAFEKKGILRILVKYMYRIALKKCKVVFFENEANKKLFVDEKIVRNDQVHVLNGAGVNLEDFPYEEYPHNSKFKFLFVGRVMKEKGIEELFFSMKRLVQEGYDCFLDVVGPFEENYKDLLDSYQNEGWLSYKGYQKDVRPFIKECDCFVLPSYHEGMANTNLECAASGRPIITSNIPGCKEAVIDGKSGMLCESRNAESLYEAMKKMINHSNREEMGKIGRKHMEELFDKNSVVEETISAIFS